MIGVDRTSDPRGRRDEVRGTTLRTCVCGHRKVAHTHYRKGSDCALCTCARFSRPSILRLIRGR